MLELHNNRTKNCKMTAKKTENFLKKYFLSTQITKFSFYFLIK